MIRNFIIAPGVAMVAVVAVGALASDADAEQFKPKKRAEGDHEREPCASPPAPVPEKN